MNRALGCCAVVLALLVGAVACSPGDSSGEVRKSGGSTSTPFQWPTTTTVPWVEATTLRTFEIPPEVTGRLFPISSTQVLSFGVPYNSHEWSWTIAGDRSLANAGIFGP